MSKILYSGLVSITFRNLKVEEIIKLVVKSGLDGIEWGGDIHVPHGNIKKAKQVAELTKDAGLNIPSYGSYYKVGCKNEEIGSFERVLETAVVLEVPTIRVWAGDRGSKEADNDWWKIVIEDSQKIAEKAEEYGIKIAYEYHDNTLTDTLESALKLLKEVGHTNLSTYWQPPHRLTHEECCQDIKGISTYLEHIHVFYWTDNPERVRHPLIDNKSNWEGYLKVVAELPGEHYVMLEFVKDDSVEQFLHDAKVLKSIIK